MKQLLIKSGRLSIGFVFAAIMLAMPCRRKCGRQYYVHGRLG